jgi:hypothetical protein
VPHDICAAVLAEVAHSDLELCYRAGPQGRKGPAEPCLFARVFAGVSNNILSTHFKYFVFAFVPGISFVQISLENQNLRCNVKFYLQFLSLKLTLEYRCLLPAGNLS